MARGKNGETLQAVEINANTVVGVVSNKGKAGSQIHMQADGDVTFHFPTGDVVVAAVAGSDFVAGPGCTGITSSSVILS